MTQHGLTLKERLVRGVQVLDDGCWVWSGSGRAAARRYRTISVPSPSGRLNVTTHRVAYEVFTGPIPEGYEIDHLCRNCACCNPDHLEAVTHAENVRRGTGWSGRQARKTHCPAGHPYTPENLVPSRLPHRVCRICKAAQERERKKAE